MPINEVEHPLFDIESLLDEEEDVEVKSVAGVPSCEDVDSTMNVDRL